MLDKKTFIGYMQRFEEWRKRGDKLNDAMKEYSPDFRGFYDYQGDQLILDLLEELMDDEYNWISYYLYEGGEVRLEDGTVLKCDSLENLYTLLTTP